MGYARGWVGAAADSGVSWRCVLSGSSKRAALWQCCFPHHFHSRGVAKGEIFVVQDKTNQSGPQSARAAAKAVSNMGMG